jgi:phosphoesterase RecJ-like protein
MIKSLIHQAKTIALFTHRDPDGDAIGSMLALWTWLETLGKTCSYHISTSIPKTFDFIKKTNIITSTYDYQDTDLIIFLDSVNPVVMFQQLRVGHEEYFASQTTLCIDHHDSNTGYATHNIINPHIGSTCELIHQLIIDRDCWPINSEVATYLYLGVSTDTGHFKYATTDQTHACAQALMQAWADTQLIIKHIYQSNSITKMQFASMVLSRAKQTENVLRTYYHESERKQQWLEREDAKFALYQMQSLDRDGIVLFIELYDDGSARLNLRSKGNIAVNTIATALDPCGGGHIPAAGCKIQLEHYKPTMWPSEIKKLLEWVVEKVNEIINTTKITNFLYLG